MGVCETNGCAVINLNGGWWLFVPHLFKKDARREYVFGGEEDGFDFYLFSGAHHVLHYFAKNMNDSVGEGHTGLVSIQECVTKEVDSGCVAVDVRFGQI